MLVLSAGSCNAVCGEGPFGDCQSGLRSVAREEGWIEVEVSPRL